MANVHLMVPRSVEEGEYNELVAIFSARRCRTTKSYQDLWDEVLSYTSAKKQEFLSKVVVQDWAADVLEMLFMVYDIERVPVWLVVELLRHRLLWREFSMEQLSQRAISSLSLEVEAPTPEMQGIVDNYLQVVREQLQQGKIPPENLREIIPQGVLVNLTIGGNLRAFHHFFFMRSSVLLQGKGGAHLKFMAIADEMQKLAVERFPNTMKVILRA